MLFVQMEVAGAWVTRAWAFRRRTANDKAASLRHRQLVVDSSAAVAELAEDLPPGHPRMVPVRVVGVWTGLVSRLATSA